MSDNSTIEWTQATWNPTTGCDKVSPGCDNCYALKLAKRLKGMGSPKYQVDGDPRTSGPGFGIQIHPDALEIPRGWRTGKRIFVNSMSDLFHAKVPVAFIQDVFDVMADTPQHSYQVLTKRSLRLRRVAGKLTWPANCWMGVSVENADHLYRIDHLRDVPAAIRFVSAEPLLGPLPGLNLAGIHWVITGGESGKDARPMRQAWARSIEAACEHGDTAFYFKQAGTVLARQWGASGKGADPAEWPVLFPREYPDA